jgi:hypothetical protein
LIAEPSRDLVEARQSLDAVVLWVRDWVCWDVELVPVRVLTLLVAVVLDVLAIVLLPELLCAEVLIVVLAVVLAAAVLLEVVLGWKVVIDPETEVVVLLGLLVATLIC